MNFGPTLAVEPQSFAKVLRTEAVPARPVSHGAMFNGNEKPIRRLGLIKDSILDMTRFRHRYKQNDAVTQMAQNGFKKNSD